MSMNTLFQNASGRLVLILFVACFLYFPLSNIFAKKKVASCKKSPLVENRLKSECKLFADDTSKFSVAHYVNISASDSNKDLRLIGDSGK